MNLKLNEFNESRKILKLFKENRQEQRPPRSYSEFSKSPKDKKHSFEKSSNLTQQVQYANLLKNQLLSAVNNVSESYHLYSWGLNNQGLTTQNYKPTMSRQQSDHVQQTITAQTGGIVQCAAGEGHTFYLNSKNEVYGFGCNQFGQLGIEGVANITKPTVIQLFRDIKVGQIACGAEHTFLLTSKGESYAWGLNIKGQLGLGSYENIAVPTLVYSLLPFGYGNTKAVGGGHKRMKSGNDPHHDISPGLKERSGSVENIMDNILSMKEKFKFRNQGKKSETAEQLTQIILQNDEVVTSVACGALHTLVLTNKFRLLSCGFGDGFALGHDDYQTVAEFKPISAFRNKSKSSPRIEKIDRICCGLSHSGCIVEGRVYLWGMLSQQREPLIFRQPTLINFHSEDAVQQHLNQEVIIELRMGECFLIMLTSRGEVYSMGENTDSQLGLEGIAYSDTPQKVNGLPLISQIAAGRNHCLALTVEQKQLFGWGANSYGQLTGNVKGGAPIQGPKMLFALPSDGTKQISCSSFQSYMLSSSNFEINIQPDESEFLQEDVSHRKSTQQNIHQNQQLREEVDRLTSEVDQYKNELEQLKMFNIQLYSKQEKMKGELSKKKQSTDDKGFRKQVNAISQTMESFLLDQKKGSQQNIKKQPSKFDIAALEVSPDKPIKHRTFQTSLDIDFSEIQLEKQISEGGYGIIYSINNYLYLIQGGKWRETIVAVKMFKIEGMQENHIRDFLSECHAMEALRHPNIVMFLGACTRPPNLAIILEYCQKGSLWSVLQNHDIALSWDDRKRIAIDAAKGVWYLHCFTPPILHRDLKSLNLLLDDGLHTKLADFGWTRTMANYMTSKIGTYQWMAPEVIGGQVYTEKADVFSYGIILWEIASREPPYRNITGLQVSIEVLNNDFRPVMPKKTPDMFARLTKRCWDRDPEKRPSFKEIIKELEIMKFPPGM